MINLEGELDLSWSKNFIISEISRNSSIPANQPNPRVLTTRKTVARLQIINAKLYAPFVTLFINDNIKFLENIKQRCKRTIS